MKRIILIHGAWHGPWCWRKLLPYLDQADCEVLTPELPCHDDNQVINLTTYIHLLERILIQEATPEHKVTLVGHSLAGLMMAALGAQYPDLIERLVYIAAFIPPSGHSLLDCSKADEETDISPAFLKTSDRNLLVLDTNKVKPFFYNTCSDLADIKLAQQKLQSQSLGPFQENVNYDLEVLRKIPSTYIACSEDKAVSLTAQKRMYAPVGEDIIVLKSCHSPFFSMPDKVAEILLNSAF